MEITSIIFDFGNVILDIDTRRTVDALRQYGFADWEKLESPEFYRDVIFPLEKGIDSPQVFYDKMRAFLQMNLSDEEIKTAWNALLFMLTEERILLLEKIKKHYAIFLLSNSNQIHYEQFVQDLSNNFNYKKFDDLFNKAYFSFELQMIKPDKKIYEFVINDQKLDPEKTLFIDDRYENIEGASTTGMHTFHLKKGIRITDLFDNDGRIRKNFV